MDQADEHTRRGVDVTPPGAARRLGFVALALVLLPVVVEAATLDPQLLVDYREPVYTALRLALANALPYLVVATSAGALAAALGGRVDVPAGRMSAWLLGTATLLGLAAAFTTPSFHEALLAGTVTVDGPCARAGGPLSGCVDLEPVAIEEAGDLARLLLPARRTPWDATVRWVGVRTAAASGRRVELVGGGAVRDVTAELAALPPGGAKLFSHTVRVGPDTGNVHLRLADDPLPPAIFLDARRSLDVAGLAVVAGGGDDLRRVDPRSGPGALPVQTLRFKGHHVDGGHAIVVLSGATWGVHDLDALLAAGGELAVDLAGEPRWKLRLTGGDAESATVALASFSKVERDGLSRFALPLSALPFGDLSPRAVVAVALVYDGPAGPFALDVAAVRAAVGASQGSGFALGTLAALDPGARPSRAMMAAGEPEPAARHGDLVRLLAAVLGLVGAAGPRTLARAARALPLHTAAGLSAGPLLGMGLEPVVRAFATPRLEHVPLALAAAAVATAVTGVAGARTAARRARGAVVRRDPRLAAIEVWMGLAALVTIAVHVSADSAGLPWVEHPPAARLLPVVVHVWASGFEAPAFVLAVLFRVAARHHGGGVAAATVIGDLWRRLVPALIFWSAAYLLLRLGKAVAFGYDVAYRRELAEGATWLRAIFLGGAQYHLYVLPLLLLLVLVFPLFSPALRRPALALGMFVTLAAWPALDTWAVANLASPEARTWALRGTMAVGFSGYGLLAFALYGLHGRARRLLLLAATLLLVAAMALVGWGAGDLAEAGTWQFSSRAAAYATWVLPAAAFTIFLALERDSWPASLRRLGALAPGIYLVHPAVLDAVEIAERGAHLPPMATVALNFVVVSTLTLLVVAGIARVRPLRFVLALDRA